MKITDTITKFIRQDIENKIVLEMACGTADFSLSAAEYAEKVYCIDIDETRLNENIKSNESIFFQKMDASDMNFVNASFDMIVIYNALYHIQDQYDKIIKECRRVLKKDGQVCIIGTWKLDISLIEEKFGNKAKHLKDNLIVRINAEDL